MCKDPWPNSTLSHLTLFGLVTFSTSLQLHSFQVFFTALSFCVRNRLKAQIALITMAFVGKMQMEQPAGTIPRKRELKSEVVVGRIGSGIWEPTLGSENGPNF